MSTLILEKTKVLSVKKHDNADSLDIITVYDWQVITGRDQYKVNDEVIYIPVNSIMSNDMQAKFFGPESKVKLDKGRIKSIKLRGALSQGLVVNTKDYTLDYVKANITKYEPPESSKPKLMQLNKPTNPFKIKAFKEYNLVEHGKYYDRVIQDGERVVVTCKLHGTAGRAGWFNREPVTMWEKFLNLLGKYNEETFCWGSHRVQIQAKPDKKHQGFKSEEQGVNFGDVYTKMVNQYGMRNRIPKGYAVYGEIVGDGVQKNYKYSCKSDEHKFYVYDVLKDGKWLDHADIVAFCQMRGFTQVPIMYVGPYNKDIIDQYINVNPLSNEINEGIVIRPVINRIASCGMIVLKYINSEFYLKDNSDFH